MSDKVNNILKENNMLKSEMERLISIIKENEIKQKAFNLIEDAFLTAESIEDIDSRALAYIEEVFDFDKAILFVDPEAVKLEVLPGDFLKRVLFTTERILRYAYVEKRPYFGAYVDGLISDFRMMENIGSYLITPLIEDGKIIGSLNLYSLDPEKLPGDGHADFVQLLASRAVIALRKLHHIRQIESQAQRDFLTNTYNKGMMHSFIQRYIDRFKADGSGFSFIITDMDCFKELNDASGHLTGDAALKDLSDAIASFVSENEVLGRFGGDEFYIITNNTDDEKMKTFFSKIAAEVDKIAQKYHMGGKLGISGGYVSVTSGKEVESGTDLVRQADAALYKGKSAGKGIFVKYSENI